MIWYCDITSVVCKFGRYSGLLEMFLALLLDLGHGVVGGAEPCHGLPILVHHELGEVPLDRVHQEAALLGLHQVLGVGHFHSQ